MKKEAAVRFNSVSKKYQLGQRTYRTLREDIVNIFRRNSEKNGVYWALKDIEFSLGSGGSLGIIGANGAGKSTMLKILAGVTRPTTGEVEVNGKIGALIELSAGFHPELSGRENIYLYGSIIGLSKSYIDKRFDEIVDFSGLEQFLDTPVKRYSSGMFARLGFSVTAHLDPDVLLIDEVLSVGDYLFQTKCINKMLEYKERGVTIIFVSHNLDSIRKLCSRAILLNKGRIQYDGDVEMTINEYYMHSSNAKIESSANEPAIELRSKCLVDPLGRKVSAVNTGDKIILDVGFQVQAAVTDVYFAFFIRHSSGVVIFDTSSDLLNGSKCDISQGQLIALKYEFLTNLLKGNYLVGVNIVGRRDGKEPEYLFYDNNIFSFAVKDNISHQGFANLNAKCMVEIKGNNNR